MTKKDPPIARHERVATIAEDRVAGDLIDALMHQVERLKRPYADLTANQQRQFQQELTTHVGSAISVACHVIATAEPKYMTGEVKSVNFKGQHDAVANVALLLPGNEELVTAAQLSGGNCVIVGVDVERYLAGLHDYPVDEDQGGLEFYGADIGEVAGMLMPVVESESHITVGELMIHGRYTEGNEAFVRHNGKQFRFEVEADSDGQLVLVYSEPPSLLAQLPFFKFQTLIEWEAGAKQLIERLKQHSYEVTLEFLAGRDENDYEAIANYAELLAAGDIPKPLSILAEFDLDPDTAQ